MNRTQVAIAAILSFITEFFLFAALIAIGLNLSGITIDINDVPLIVLSGLAALIATFCAFLMYRFILPTHRSTRATRRP
ncbi:MAG: hypothetical protein AAFN08_08180 [Cyanobacteria bacterium J06559_3]